MVGGIIGGTIGLLGGPAGVAFGAGMCSISYSCYLEYAYTPPVP